MPSRRTSLANSLSTRKLPILTFLAPRVFEPWPRELRPRGACGTASASSGHRLKSMIPPESTIIHRSRFRDTEPRPSGSPRGAEMEDIRFTGPSDRSTSMDHGGIHNDDAQFRRAFADIWGPDRTKKRFKEELYVPPENVKDMDSTGMVGLAQSVIQKTERRPRTMTRLRMGFVSSQIIQPPYEVRERKHLYNRSTSIVRIIEPRVWTKYIRLAARQNVSHTSLQGSRLDRISFLWTNYFSVLSRKYDSKLCRYQRVRHFRIRGVHKSTRHFERKFSHASLLEVQKAWEALPEKQRDLIWIPVMLGVLERRPSWALKFLIASVSSKPHPPSYAISDSLEYIVCSFLYKVKTADIRSVTVLCRTILWLLDKFDRDYLHLSQKTIFWLLSHANVNQAEQLYKGLLQCNHPLNVNTLLQFAHKFAREGQTRLGIHVMQEFYDKGGDFTQPKVESVCATLLQRKYRSISDRVTSDSDIYGLLLSFGLRPNIIFYNILLQNAIESGDSETAWKIHDMMPGLGIEADAHTYSILLNAAKLSMDFPTMERIMEIVESKGIANEFICTDLLHAMFLKFEQERRAAYRSSPPPAPLKRMLPLYVKYFDLEPLKELLTQAYIDLAVPSDRPKMHPSKATLVVMLIALLRGFTNANSIPEWYTRFRTLVLSGHPDIAPLAESTHIYDAVIMALGKWPKTLGLCTGVISDMFSSYSAAQEALKRLHPPVRNRQTLQTTMGSNLTPALTSPPNAHRLQRQGAENETGAGSIGGPERKWVAEFHENVESFDENPSGESRVTISVESSARTSEAVVAKPSSDPAIIHEHCKPSVRTWSILLKAFIDHNQPRAAEKVLTMMQRRGITPNQFTWNSLAIGYARLQDITSTVDVIDRFENEGWDVDNVIVSGLQVIENRGALKEALRQKDLRRAKKKKYLQKAAAEELATSWSGGLSAVLEKEEIFEEKADAQEEPSAHHGHRRAMRLLLDDDELLFLEEARPATVLDDHNPIMDTLVPSVKT